VRRSCREGHAFCKSCIDQCLKNKQQCPICREEVLPQSLFRVRPLESLIDTLEVRCIHSSLPCDQPPDTRSEFCRKVPRLCNASDVQSSVTIFKSATPGDTCLWKGTLAEREEHLKICPYAPVRCGLGSSTYAIHSCPTVVQRRDLERHQEACRYRTVECHLCNAKIEAHHLLFHMSNICPHTEIECRHGCGARFLRRDGDVHYAACLLALVKCPFAVHGCKGGIGHGGWGMVPRKDMATHLTENAHSHNLLLSAKLTAVEADLARTRREQQCGIRHVSWKIRDVSHRLANHAEVNSPTFSISIPQGSQYSVSLGASFGTKSPEHFGLYLWLDNCELVEANRSDLCTSVALGSFDTGRTIVGVVGRHPESTTWADYLDGDHAQRWHDDPYYTNVTQKPQSIPGHARYIDFDETCKIRERGHGVGTPELATLSEIQKLRNPRDDTILVYAMICVSPNGPCELAS